MYSPYYYKMAGDLLLVMEDYGQALDMYKLIIRKRISIGAKKVRNIDKEIAYAETKMGKYRLSKTRLPTGQTRSQVRVSDCRSL